MGTFFNHAIHMHRNLPRSRVIGENKFPYRVAAVRHRELADPNRKMIFIYLLFFLFFLPSISFGDLLTYLR